MVPWAGVEPARSFERGILSPLRLPISPPRQINLISCLLYIKMKKMLHFFMFSSGILVTYFELFDLTSCFIANINSAKKLIQSKMGSK